MNRPSLLTNASTALLALFVGIILAPAVSSAADRLRMIDNSSALGIKDCVRAAAAAITREDLDAFVKCFASDQRRTLRKRAAVMFVTHRVSLDLVDSQIITAEENRAEVAVKYRAVLSDDTFDIVSILRLVKEDGEWRIAREKVETTAPVRRDCSSGGCGRQVFRFGGGGDVELDLDVPIRRGGCANGRCRL